MQNILQSIRRADRRLVATVLLVVLLLLLTCHMMMEVGKYTDNQYRLMTTTVTERILANRTENPVPINPTVEARTQLHFRSYPRTMLFLIAAYIAVCIWNWKTDANLHTYLSAVFLLAGIGCSYKFMFGGFYGAGGEAGFLVAGVFAGVMGYLVWTWMNKQIGPNMYVFLGVVVVILILWVALFGTRVNGNKGWIRIGPVLLQPSEFIKCILIMMGAAAMNNRARGIAYSILCMASCAFLVMCHDLGMACVMLALFLMMTYIIFDKKRYAVILILLGIIVVYVAYENTQYVKDRLAGWTHAMTRLDSDQQRRFITAVIKAGWSGMGVANATAFTSLTAAGTDAAVAGILAVYGLPMLLAVMGCYIMILLCIADNHGVDITCHPILFQIALTITVQVVLNFCGSLDLLPFTGITAPLLSTGGSSTVTMCGMLGIAAACMRPTVQNRSV